MHDPTAIDDWQLATWYIRAKFELSAIMAGYNINIPGVPTAVWYMWGWPTNPSGLVFDIPTSRTEWYSGDWRVVDANHGERIIQDLIDSFRVAGPDVFAIEDRMRVLGHDGYVMKRTQRPGDVL